MTRKTWIILAAFACGMMVCLGCFLLALVASRPSVRDALVLDATLPPQNIVQKQPAAATNVKPVATLTLARHTNEITLKEIQTKYESMTGLQRTQYIKTLAGKRVYWNGKVDEVESNGDIRVDLGQKATYRITLKGVPQSIGINFNKSKPIAFDATISNANDFLGLNIDLDLIALD